MNYVLIRASRVLYTMRNVKVKVPVLFSEQKKIASVLGAIDDKIEENERINNNLAA